MERVLELMDSLGLVGSVSTIEGWPHDILMLEVEGEYNECSLHNEEKAFERAEAIVRRIAEEKAIERGELISASRLSRLLNPVHEKILSTRLDALECFITMGDTRVDLKTLDGVIPCKGVLVTYIGDDTRTFEFGNKGELVAVRSKIYEMLYGTSKEPKLCYN